jgi:hypothetical protein
MIFQRKRLFYLHGIQTAERAVENVLQALRYTDCLKFTTGWNTKPEERNMKKTEEEEEEEEKKKKKQKFYAKERKHHTGKGRKYFLDLI